VEQMRSQFSNLAKKTDEKKDDLGASRKLNKGILQAQT
jgi:hypothetical protein